MSSEDKPSIDSFSKSLDRISGWVKQADQKAAFGLTLTLAFLTAGLGRIKDASIICSKLITLDSYYQIIFYIYLLSFIIFITASILVIAFLLNAVFPRVKPENVSGSLLYFGDISKLPIDKYREEFANLSISQLENQLIDQAHEVSNITSKKYKFISIGYKILWFVIFSGIIFIGGTSILSALFNV